MAWVPIQESGISFTFSGDPQLSSSVVSVTASSFSFWLISDLVEPVSFRVTAQSYLAESEFGITTQAAFSWGETQSQQNTTLDGSAFTPSPILGQITQQDIDQGFGLIEYNGAGGSEWPVNETFQYLVEVEVSDPAELGPLNLIAQTYRAFRGTDNSFSAWIRGAEGRVDLTGLSLSVYVIPYGSNKEVAILTAAGDAQGKLDFTLPQATAYKFLPNSLYRLEVRASNGTETQTAHAGLLSVV